MLRERATLPLRRRKLAPRSSVCMGMWAPIVWLLTRNGKSAKVRDFRTFARRNLGSLAVPFQGWSVIFLPVRSTVVALHRISRFFTLSVHASGQRTPPQRLSSSQEIRQHPRRRLCGYGDWALLEPPATSLGTPESRDPSRRHN